MRICVNEKLDAQAHATYQSQLAMHPGYKPVAYFNGQRIFFVVLADEEKGEIVRYKRSDKGHYVFTEDGSDIEQELIRGVVSIRWEKNV